MSCLQAHSLGVQNCLTLIHRADYAAVISASGSQMGIRAAVSPREATRREIQRFITTDSYHVREIIRRRGPDRNARRQGLDRRRPHGA